MTGGEAEVIVGLNGASALALVLMTAGAIIMPPVAKRIAIPVAVAEIVYGFAIGGSGFDIAGDPNNPFIRFLSDLGFAFFLFLAGLEIDFEGIENTRELLLPFVTVSLCFFNFISIHFGWGIREESPSGRPPSRCSGQWSESCTSTPHPSANP